MIAASVGLFLLVVARMAVLVRQQERSVDRERALREAGAALVRGHGRASIGRRGALGARGAGRRRPTAALPAADDASGAGRGVALERRDRLSSQTTPGGSLLRGLAAGGAAQLPDDVHAELLLSERPSVAGTCCRWRCATSRAACCSSAGPARLSASRSAALQSLATSVSLALESTALTEDLHRRESEARFGSLVAHSSDLITVIAARRHRASTRARRSSACSATRRRRSGPRFDELLPERSAAGCWRCCRAAATSDAGPDGDRVPLRHRDGRWLQFEVLHTNLLDDEHVRGIVLNSRDVSERKAFEEQLAHQAFHDPVTRLANRALFADRVAARAARGPARRAAASPSCSSTSTTSRRSTTASATPPATRCCEEVARRLADDACAPERHRRPLRRRRVRRAARGHRGRAARPPTWPSGSWTPSREPIQLDGKRGVRARQHRHLPSPTTSRASRRRPSCSATPTSPCTWPSATARAATASSSRRCTRASLERLELRADLQRAIDDRPARAALPAGGPAADTSVSRRRGAAALAAPRARPDPARPVHPARRGDGPDHPDRPLGAARGAAAGARSAASSPRDAAADDERQPLGQAAAARPTIVGDVRDALDASRARSRRRWCSRSPRA